MEHKFDIAKPYKGKNKPHELFLENDEGQISLCCKTCDTVIVMFHDDMMELIASSCLFKENKAIKYTEKPNA